MIALQSIVMAFSCFTAIPMPQVEWDDKNMRYLMAAFPLVGALIGGAVWLWWLACDAAGFGGLMRSAGLTLIPLILTGGIHMDGFSDVTDAQSSHASPERKRQILKDPHTGAFATMGVCAYLIAYLALASELDTRMVPALACVPVVSRCVCAYMAVTWQAASPKGMFATIHEAASSRVVCVTAALALVAAGVVMIARGPLGGVIALGTALVLAAWLKHFSAREFGGMSGDLLGFYVQSSELAMLAALVVAGRVA